MNPHQSTSRISISSINNIMEDDRYSNQHKYNKGSKPLSFRDDIHVNPKPGSRTTPTRNYGRKESLSDSSIEGVQSNVTTCYEKSSPSKNINTPEKSNLPKWRKSAEKIPYFLDGRREADRLRAKYGKPHPLKRKRTPEKLPYFTNAEREECRLKAKYDNSRRLFKRKSRSKLRKKSRIKSRSPRKRSRRRNRNKARHRRSPLRRESRIKSKSPSRRSRRRNRSKARHRSGSKGRSPTRHRNHDRNHRSLSRGRHRDRSSSRNRSRRRSPYPEQRYIPVEYPCSAGWIAPPMSPYPRNPLMLRSPMPHYPRNPLILRPPIPFYPLRLPFAPMDFPPRPPRFPGQYPRPYLDQPHFTLPSSSCEYENRVKNSTFSSENSDNL